MFQHTMADSIKNQNKLAFDGLRQEAFQRLRGR